MPRSADFLGAVAIGVTELERSERFYTQALGMETIRRVTLPHLDELILTHEGRTAVVLVKHTDGVERIVTDLPVRLVFYVVDPAAVCARVADAGGQVTAEPAAHAEMGGALIGFAKDPDGYVIELIQRPARA